VSRAAVALAGLRAVFRSPNLRRVEVAWGGTITAEWMHFVALGVFAYQIGGTLGVGVVGLVRMLPVALIAPFAAYLGDRFRRERFLLAIAVLGSVALAASALAFFAGKQEVLIFALAAVAAVSSTLFRPAHQALLPSLAHTPEELIASNGATSTIESLGTLLGPLVAGVLVSTASVGTAFAAASASLLLSVLMLLRVDVEGRLVAIDRAAGGVAQELTSGLGMLARERDPRLIAGLMVSQAFVRGCLNVLIVVVVFRVLDTGEGMVGYLTAALGVGGLLGAFGAVTLEGRRLAIPLGVALVFWGAPIAFVAPWDQAVAGLVLLAVIGAANSVEDVAGFTLLQRIVPDDVLTRVLGGIWGLVMGAVAIGSILTPALVDLLGPRTALVAVGGILPVLTAVSWRRLREIDLATSAPARELALLDAVGIFGPLSVAAKEHLAAKLVPVQAAAGEVVIRAGDPGDRFYVLADGKLEVDADGRRSLLAERGDSFGEIALVRAVPRTATVTAVTDCELYALERDDFLAAVTGHVGVRAAADAVVEQRLAGAATS
jgi:MFS family permease